MSTIMKEPELEYDIAYGFGTIFIMSCRREYK